MYRQILTGPGDRLPFRTKHLPTVHVASERDSHARVVKQGLVSAVTMRHLQQRFRYRTTIVQCGTVLALS